MMSDANQLRTGVLATVIGGLALSFVLWTVGYVDEAWTKMRAVVSSLARWSATQVSLPVWLIVVVVAIAILAIRLPRRSKSVADVDQANQVFQSDIDESLGELELAVLAAFAKRDGTPMPLDHLASMTGATRLRLSAALERLVNVELLTEHHNIVHGTSWGLTRAGRDWLLANGFA